ncbi:MAG: BamA/TamA family outer membrane protein [Ferruginibacter sp.]
MHYKIPDKNNPFTLLALLSFLIFFSACSKKIYQPNKPFPYKNNIEVKGGSFTKDELAALKQRLNGQLDDSSRAYNSSTDGIFKRKIFHYPVFDTLSAALSAKNMIISMNFLGYYSNTVTYKIIDTVKSGDQLRVTVKYIVEAGPATLIDTVSYRLKKEEFQQLASQEQARTFLIRGKPATKQDVLAEKSRLITLYRNNGYYKFSSDELAVRGDTTIAALTNVDDPLEILKALSEAQLKKDSPTIRLSVDLIPPKPSDSNRLTKYYINNVYIFPDYFPTDSITDPTLKHVKVIHPNDSTGKRVDSVFYHAPIFKTNFLTRNMYLKTGDVYNQENIYRSLNSFSQKAVWQSVNIQTQDVKGTKDKVNLIVQLIPAKRNTIEGNIEASLSSSNVNNIGSSNLFGLSGDIGWTTRNLGGEGVEMTNKLGGGIEFSQNKNSGRSSIINSNDISFSNSISYPKLIQPYQSIYQLRNKLMKPSQKLSKENFINRSSFINSSVSYVNRIDLFDLQTVNFATGVNIVTQKPSEDITKQKIQKYSIKFPNIEFTNLYHQTDSFTHILDANPFLKYSFRTALVVSAAVGYQADFVHSKDGNKQSSIKVNMEFPLPIGFLKQAVPGDNIFKKYLRQFIKTDAEYIYKIKQPARKLEKVARLFVGVGIPLSRSDTTLPFFKQYFGGGSTSMRGWPVRGIGRGAQPLKPFTNISAFNDRTGDIQLEMNYEIRKTLFSIIPNSITVGGVLFADAGNIWNFKNSKASGIDSTQFEFKNLYKQLGVDAGAGIAIDFTYFVLRFNGALRFKRPDISENSGWQLPSPNLKNLFGRSGKEWRYENFNFTIGVGWGF